MLPSYSRGLACRGDMTSQLKRVAVTRPSVSSRRSTTVVRAGLEYDQLKGLSVVRANSGERVELLSLWQVGTRQVEVTAYMDKRKSWKKSEHMTCVVTMLIPMLYGYTCASMGVNLKCGDTLCNRPNPGQKWLYLSLHTLPTSQVGNTLRS